MFDEENGFDIIDDLLNNYDYDDEIDNDEEMINDIDGYYYDGEDNF